MKYYSPVAEGYKYYIKEYHINGIKPQILYSSLHIFFIWDSNKVCVFIHVVLYLHSTLFMMFPEPFNLFR